MRHVDILFVCEAIFRTVLAQEMHGSSQSGVGSSIPAVTTSHRPFRLWRMRQLMRTSLRLLAVGLTVSFGHSFCQASSLMPPTGFSFAGYWQCSGSFPGSGREHRSVYHGESSADGKWVDLTETDVEPKGYVGRYELGTDAGQDKLVFIDMNSSGYAIFDSPGWDGHTLTVTSTEVLRYSSAAPKNRFLYTVNDPQHFDVEWQYQKAGAWASGDLLHCAAQTPRLAVNYAPNVHTEGMLAGILRAFLESKPTLFLTLQLPF